MTAGSANTLLWALFAGVSVLAGLRYCISGYKKGLWRALGSLGAVAISVAASVWLGRWIAEKAAPSFADAIPVETLLPGEYVNEFTVAALEMLLPTVATVVLAMVLYGLLMLILTPIISGIVGLLLGRGLITKNAGLKWLGFLVGVVTSLAFALCWLTPVYGTLAVAAPVAQLLAETVPQEDPQQQAQARETAAAVRDHMLVQLSAREPMKQVYTELSQVHINGETVSLSQMSDAVEALLPFFQGGETGTQQPQDNPEDTVTQQVIADLDVDLLQQNLEQLGQEQQTQIADALKKIGADTLEEAKKLVQNMDISEIKDLISELDLDWLKEFIPGAAAE